MGIALGLAAALSWGLADYLATLAPRRPGTLRVVLGFHFLATAGLAAAAGATGALSDVSVGDLPPFVAIGALGWFSYLAFYRALAIGPISIVSPIVSGYAAVTVILAVLILRRPPQHLARIFLGRIATALFIVPTAILLGQWRFPDRSRTLLGLIAAIAVLDTAGYVAFNVGVQNADTSLVATAAAPYAVVPVALGVAILHERPAPVQWLRGVPVLRAPF